MNCNFEIKIGWMTMIHQSIILRIQTAEHSGKIQGLKAASRVLLMGTGVLVVGLWYNTTIHSILYSLCIFIATSLTIFIVSCIL